ncbi:MAG: hypothetical protein QOE33_561 [Acidobacteriota bacterium]|nr:hypothetical protein [Acidobacteriota bacterium]
MRRAHNIVARAPLLLIASLLRRTSLLRRALLFALCVATCATLVATNALAASLDDYRTRVNAAFNYAGDLSAALAEDDYGVDSATAARAIAALRETLPPHERVEWTSGALEVDNSWLHKELEAYDTSPAADTTRRKEIVTRLRERLGALKRELDTTAAASNGARDREAEKGRLQTILRRPEYNEQAARGGALQNLWERIKDLLRRLSPRSKQFAPGVSSTLSLIARIFVYALALAVIVFVIWRFGPGVWARVSARRRKSRAQEARIVLGETLAPDESAADLINEAERLARAGDLRGAIRKAYIAVLCELGERKIIRLAQHKTNRDYLAGVRDRAELYGTLRPLTQSFEQHWYGFAPATPTDWDQYRALCHRAIQSGV